MRIHRWLQTTQSSKGKGKGKAEKRSKKLPVLFTPEQEQKIVDFLRDNEILYNKRLMDYMDGSKREAVWDKFCNENNLNKDAGQMWFQREGTLFGKVTHMKFGHGEPVLTERQKWTKDNFDFLSDHIMRHLTAKSEFRAPKGSASQASAAAGSSSIRQTVHSELFQDASQDTLQTSRTWKHICLLPSHVLSALAESQRRITELKDIVVKKFGEEKPGDPRLGFCDFLKVEVVQLISDSYDEFQQKTSNLLMRLKRRDKQQQKYQHGIGMSMAQAIT